MPYSSTEGKDWIRERVEALAPKSVFDVGAGSGTYADLLRPLLPDAVIAGCEVHEPYVARFDLGSKYDVVVVGDVRRWQQIPRADVVILGDVIEHMEHDDALRVWCMARRAAERGAFLSLPIVEYPQGAGDDNPHEAHLHTWSHESVLAELEGITEADPVAILATLISAFSTMVGAGPRVQILDDQHPVTVWPLILGHTSIGRKGMSWGVAKRVIQKADDSFYRECVTSGLSSGEGLITAVADEEEDTGEVGGKQRLIIESEYSVTMARAGRDGNTLGGVLRQAWEGDNLRTLTRASLTATRPHIGIIAHITPGEFRARVKSAEMAGGTYNRFLPIYSERLKEIADGEGADPVLITAIAAPFTERVKAAKDVCHVGLTPDARELWRQVVYPALSAAPGREGAVAQFTARATAYCRRLAAVYALAAGETIVGRTHMEAAYQLVNYSRASAAYALGAAGTGDPNVDRVLNAVMAAGAGGLTRTRIANNVFAKHLTAARLDDVLASLAAQPGITCVSRPTGGRPVEVWAFDAKKAKQAEKASPPVETSSARAAEQVRTKSTPAGAALLVRTSSAEAADHKSAGQEAFAASSASSAGTGASGTAACAACGHRLDRTLVENGETTHPDCGAGELDDEEDVDL